MQVQLGAGLRAQASYTYSTSIDDQSSSLGRNEFANGQARTVDPYNKQLNRGRSDFDIRHNLSINFTYDAPFGTGHTHGRPRPASSGHYLGRPSEAIRAAEDRNVQRFQPCDFAIPSIASLTIFNSPTERNATAGQITSTSTPARQVQLALRVLF
jgi:hypothetical protein